MITVMRRYRRSLQVGLLVVIAAFIVTSVVVFGASSRAPSRPDTVATVNGESIPTERFERAYRSFYERYAQMYRDRFSPEVAEALGLRQHVVDSLVREVAIVQRARAEGMELTDEELNAHVHAMPIFQDGGRFSLVRYEEILRGNGFSKPAFEAEMRRELTRAKMESTIKNGVKVSEHEVEQAYVHRREEVRAAWALVDLQAIMATVTPTDEELQKYLAEHAADFRRPEGRRVQYAAISPKGFSPAVTDAEIEKYYKENAEEFETPRQVKASHILVSIPTTGGSEAEDKAKAKVADLIRRAKAGEDFAKLARENSGDAASAPKGGDLGWISKGQMVAPFEDAAFALKKGEITAEPVRSPFGFHAIRVSDLREEIKKPLSAVTGEIRARLVAEAADRAAKAKGDELRPVLQAAVDFMAEAKARGLTPAETTITRSSRSDPMEETAFALAVGGVSLPIKTPAGYTLVKSIEVVPAVVPPLAEIRDRVTAAFKRQRGEAQALERAKRVVAEAKGGDLVAAAKTVGATTGEAGRFSRTKPAEKLPGDVMATAFRTPLNAVSEPVKTPQGYYVVKVLERVPPDMANLAGEREKLNRELLAQKQAQAWETWVSAARASAKVELSERFQPGKS